MPAVLRAAEIAPFLFAKPLAFGDFPQTWTIKGGQTLTARAVRPEDFARQRAFVDGLSRESRYYRFLTGGLVSDEFIAQFVRSRCALVLTTREEGDGAEERIVANGEYVAGEGGVAELALVVTDRWQGRGIGRRLVQTLVQGARAQRLRALRGEVLSENRRMLAILREHGFSVRLHPGDALLHEAMLTLAPARQTNEWLPEDWFAMR
ncbi:GNAT family N-acetyltransferase [Cupriavidus cauae]|uniref:GNAT family N-acetyltransferase n=1 Tax=Cupriavidus cauae TaxID=2608999 RepID=UPI0022433AF2|nr:GNAT family N-acetyltransferase [Cupriavidus cauae]UZN50985.1 GNAT family N-acetyltransferase [Cupriavidus cauae]